MMLTTPTSAPRWRYGLAVVGMTAFGVTCQDASGISGGIRYLDIGVAWC